MSGHAPTASGMLLKNNVAGENTYIQNTLNKALGEDKIYDRDIDEAINEQREAYRNTMHQLGNDNTNLTFEQNLQRSESQHQQENTTMSQQHLPHMSILGQIDVNGIKQNSFRTAEPRKRGKHKDFIQDEFRRQYNS